MNDRQPRPDEKRNPNRVEEPDTAHTQDTPGRDNPPKSDQGRGDQGRGESFGVKSNVRKFGPAA